MINPSTEVRCPACAVVFSLPPLARRALEACEQFASSGYEPYQQVAVIGRESLATKPKMRWQVRTDRWYTSVVDTQAHDRLGFSGTAPEAKAVANALNALEQGFMFEGCKFEREAAK